HARLLHDAGLLGEALSSVDRAIALEPGLADTHAFRGALLIKCNRPNEALAALDRALQIDPDRGTSHVDPGLALHALGRPGEAIEALDRGSRIEGDDPHVQFVVGLVDLLHGRWQQGLSRFEFRLELSRFNHLHHRFLDSVTAIDQRFAAAPDMQLPWALPRWN